MAKFYAVNPATTKNVELNDFVGQIGKENEASENKQRPMTSKNSDHGVQ
jgi:hypothetical protein